MKSSRLKADAEKMHIAHNADNWQFLRPESEQRAKEVVQEQFGVAFQKEPSEDGDGYMFIHTPLILLANADGYVERAYKGNSPDTETIIEDLKRAR